MGLKLESKEAFDAGIRRIMLNLIERGLEDLRGESKDIDEAIHDARVCIKKIRAILRLVRHSFDREMFEEEDKSFRDTARMLSKVRERAAMFETFDLLVQQAEDPGLESLLETARGSFKRSGRIDEAQKREAMSEAAASLGEAKERIADWPRFDPEASISRGLRRVFKRGRLRFDEAYEGCAVETFHEWRKQVKHFLYQTRVLRPIWPNMMNALSSDLKRIGNLLSADHDLALLREAVSKMDLGNEKELAALFTLIDSRRKQVEQEAHLHGARIYGEKPRAFVKRMQKYWTEWHDEGK